MKMQKILDRLVSLVGNKLSPREMVVGFILFMVSLTGFIFSIKTLTLPYITTERIRYVGNVTEGFVGSVKTVNPFAPQTQNEKDIGKLLFSGLTRQIDSPTGFIFDLASNITPSEDNLSYTATLSNAEFHDGSHITADDVLFSFEGLAKDKPGFEQVSVSKIDDKTIYFKLEKPDQQFLQELDFPIVKKGMTSVLQTGFVGSGPYKINAVVKDGTDSISQIELKTAETSPIKKAYIQNYTIKFYPTEEDLAEAIKNEEIDVATGIRNNLLVNSLPNSYSIATSSMSGTFVLFINQTKDNGLDIQSLRHYLSQSINRTDLVNQVFNGYAVPFETITDLATNTIATTTLDDLKKDDLFLENGLLSKKVESDSASNTATSTPLKFTISTLNTPELVATAEIIKSQLKSAGVVVEVKIFEKNELGTILETKNYDLFLFGFYVPSVDTYYNFFHSSQTTYPKLNISGYANKKVDIALEAIRASTQKGESMREEEVGTVSQNLYKDMPVIFLYRSEFVAVHKNNLSLKLPQKMQSVDDRYQFITDWYTESERVFPWLQNNKLTKYIETNF